MCPACGARQSAPAGPPAREAEQWQPPSPAPPAPGGWAEPAPAPGAPRPAAGARTQPPVPAQHEGTRFAGVAGDVRRRRSDQEVILEFRIERHDASGDRLAPVPIRLAGYNLIGSLSDGDQVQVDGGTWRKGTLRVTAAHNLTTGAEVRVRTYRALRTVFLIIFLLIFTAILGAALYQFVIHVLLHQPG